MSTTKKPVMRKTFSLPASVIIWIEKEAKKANRSSSNFLALLIEKAMKEK